MVIYHIAWSEWSIEHILKHNVTKEEVEEVCFNNKPMIRKGKDGTYYILGQTDAGRYLFIVVVKEYKGAVRIITARDMDSKERKLFKR